MASPEDGASTDVTDVTMEEVPAPRAEKLSLTLKMHEIAKDAQNQNGLRHGDYHQYRQYCTRRLKRVRSSREVRFMFGKGKSFVQKVMHRCFQVSGGFFRLAGQSRVRAACVASGSSASHSTTLSRAVRLQEYDHPLVRGVALKV